MRPQDLHDFFAIEVRHKRRKMITGVGASWDQAVFLGWLCWKGHFWHSPRLEGQMFWALIHDPVGNGWSVHPHYCSSYFTNFTTSSTSLKHVHTARAPRSTCFCPDPFLEVLRLIDQNYLERSLWDTRTMMPSLKSTLCSAMVGCEYPGRYVTSFGQVMGTMVSQVFSLNLWVFLQASAAVLSWTRWNKFDVI